MKKTLLLLSLILSFSAPAKTEFSDSQFKQLIIKNSIASYSGQCPCPFSLRSNGSRCDGRSAYSKPGGAEPLCYEDDITKRMVDSFRRSNRL